MIQKKGHHPTGHCIILVREKNKSYIFKSGKLSEEISLNFYE